MPRGDTSGTRGRGALVAALVAIASHLPIPLLPIHGNGHQFVWSTWSEMPSGQFVRWVAQWLIGGWIGAVALAYGILMLRRHRSGVAAGVFVAIAIVVAGALANGILPRPSDVFHAWRTTLVLGLQAIEVVALAVAAWVAMRRWV